MTTHVPATVAGAPAQNQPATYTLAIMDPAQFEHMQRVGKMLALSPLFPEHLRKGGLETAIANGVLVVNMALRLREDPLTVAQNIYFVGGKPGWMTTYLIAKANQHGVFDGPIEWKVEGKGDSLSVTAYATLARNGRVVSVTCDMALAKAEGWTSNKKYQTMPEQMLRYRSATWLVRLYCPEVLVGVPAAIDHDMPMRDVTPDDSISETRARSRREPEPDLIEQPSETKDAPETATDPVEGASSETKIADRTVAQEIEPGYDIDERPAQAAKEMPAAEAETKPSNGNGAMALVAISNQIMKDIEESGMLDAIIDFHGSQGNLDRLKNEAPALYHDVMNAIAKARENEAVG